MSDMGLFPPGISIFLTVDLKITLLQITNSIGVFRTKSTSRTLFLSVCEQVGRALWRRRVQKAPNGSILIIYRINNIVIEVLGNDVNGTRRHFQQTRAFSQRFVALSLLQNFQNTFNTEPFTTDKYIM